jgi:hypothetical protein
MFKHDDGFSLALKTPNFGPAAVLRGSKARELKWQDIKIMWVSPS